jgi:acyl-CoA reductase-like NAD-dependent aldehyde dehydrogenase
MPSKEQAPFEVACPDCGAMLKIDPATRAVIAHTPAPRKRTFEDFETAARAMREQEERKESLFRQAVDAEKNKDELQILASLYAILIWIDANTASQVIEES